MLQCKVYTCRSSAGQFRLFVGNALSLTRRRGGAVATTGGTHTKHHNGMRIFKDILKINQLHLANSTFLSLCNWWPHTTNKFANNASNINVGKTDSVKGFTWGLGFRRVLVDSFSVRTRTLLTCSPVTIRENRTDPSDLLLRWKALLGAASNKKLCFERRKMKSYAGSGVK